MINEFLNSYKNFKVSTLSKLSNNLEGINDELDFLDDELVASKIRYIQRVQKQISDNISDAEVEKLNFLISKNKEFNDEIIMLASNGRKNIDFCLSVIDNNSEFKPFLQAIKSYYEQNKIEAKDILDKCYGSKDFLLEHYLINAIYGVLLYDNNEYAKAIIYLGKAAEKRPSCIEIHKLLRLSCKKVGNNEMFVTENEIIEMLGEE